MTEPGAGRRGSTPASRAAQPTTTNQQTMNLTLPTKTLAPVLALLLSGSLAASAADGYGRNATGGAGGTSVTSTTAAQLKQYVESATTYTITVSGTINL